MRKRQVKKIVKRHSGSWWKTISKGDDLTVYALCPSLKWATVKIIAEYFKMDRKKLKELQEMELADWPMTFKTPITGISI